MSAPWDLDSPFVFALCQRGAERALKEELGRIAPRWAAAYQRPGLVTFRTEGPVHPSRPLSSVFARSWGQSIGSARTADEVLARASFTEPVRVQVVERDLYRPDEAPRGVEVGALAAQVEAELRAQAHDDHRFGAAVREGELVLDVVVGPDDPWLIGLHRHAAGRSPHAGGRYPVQVPDDAPSRAYAKIEEAIAAFRLPVEAGQHALELGAAPGGAAYALARRGVSVLAVDPAAMDPRALDYVGPGGARVVHLSQPMGALTAAHVTAPVDWLLMDVHLAPQVALHGVRRIVAMLASDLRGVVFTLKLNDWAFARRIPEFLRQVEALGVVAPRALQLASHRQEIAIAGMMRRPAYGRGRARR